MRIYNGKKSQLEFPLGNGEKITVGPQSISGDFLPSTPFLNMLVTSFHYDEIALIVNGVQEMNLCSSVSACNGFVCYNVAEAVERFAEKKIEKNPAYPTSEKEEEVKETEEKTKRGKKEKNSAPSENL